MGKTQAEKENPAFLIIDMVKDNFIEERNLPITPFARQIIKPINQFIGVCRKRDWPVVFSTDAFHRQDFFFTGKMNPHSLAGTTGAEVMEDLDQKDEDYWLPKPSLSAFFRTGLDLWLHRKGVTLCAVAGIATNFCVLATVLDAVCHDFKSVLLEDCSAAASESLHEQTLGLYRKNPLYPLLRVQNSEAFAREFS